MNFKQFRKLMNEHSARRWPAGVSLGDMASAPCRRSGKTLLACIGWNTCSTRHASREHRGRAGMNGHPKMATWQNNSMTKLGPL